MISKQIPDAGGLPWVGQMPQMTQDPLQFLLGLARTHGPIARFTMFGKSFVLVSDSEYVREVLVTKANLFPKSSRDLAIMGPLLGYGLLTTNGAQHKKLRKLAQPAFHAKRITTYADAMTKLATSLTDEWRNGETRDINVEMLQLTMYIVSKTLFDTDRSAMSGMADQIGHAIHQLQEVADFDFTWYDLVPQWLPLRVNRQRQPARHMLDQIIEGMIAERRPDGSNAHVEDRGDLLSMLMLAEDENGERLTDDEVRDEAINLFVAGHETTSNALTWTWYLLSQHPHVADKLRAELDTVLAGRTPTLHDLANLPYTQQVIKESMRLYPPAWVLNGRQAAEDCTIGDYEIKQGQVIFIAPYVMHRLAHHFPNPDEFQPERFTPAMEEALPRYTYMPFGGGPRICIGNSFAMMEAQLLLATIAQRFELQLDPAARVATQPMITLTTKYGLPMQIRARQHMTDPAEQRADPRTSVDEAELVLA